MDWWAHPPYGLNINSSTFMDWWTRPLYGLSNKGWVWFSFLKLGFLKKLSFQKVHNKKVFFQKAECLVKTVKKCFLKKLSVWLALIKVAVWGVNYQKWQCIYKEVYFILKSILWNYFFSLILANNNLLLKIYYDNLYWF